jgi:hypothetical protein
MKRRLIPSAFVAVVALVGCQRGNAAPAAHDDTTAARPVATAGADETPSIKPDVAKTPDDPNAAPERKREYREVTVPAGTVLPLELRSTVSSASSHVEDPVHARLRRSILVGGLTALPAGSTVLGHVTSAKRSARVKGRAQIGFRFTQLDLPGEGERLAIRTSPVGRVAPATKKRDAAEIGAGAAGGAIVGGILGGGSGAAKGSAIGGAAGTGVVLSTRGKEVAVHPGALVSVKLLSPLTVRVPVK